MRVVDRKERDPEVAAKAFRQEMALRKAHLKRLRAVEADLQQQLATAEADPNGARRYNLVRDVKESLRQLEDGPKSWEALVPELVPFLHTPGLRATRAAVEKLREELAACEARMVRPYRVTQTVSDGERMLEPGEVMLLTTAQAREFAEYFDGPVSAPVVTR